MDQLSSSLARHQVAHQLTQFDSLSHWDLSEHKLFLPPCSSQHEIWILLVPKQIQDHLQTTQCYLSLVLPKPVHNVHFFSLAVLFSMLIFFSIF